MYKKGSRRVHRLRLLKPEAQMQYDEDDDSLVRFFKDKMTKLAMFSNMLNVRQIYFDNYSVAEIAVMQACFEGPIWKLYMDLSKVNSVTIYDHLMKEVNIMECKTIDVIDQLYIRIGPHVTQEDLHIIFILFKLTKDCRVILHYDRESSPLDLNLCNFFDFGKGFPLEIRGDIISSDLLLAFQIIQYEKKYLRLKETSSFDPRLKHHRLLDLLERPHQLRINSRILYEPNLRDFIMKTEPHLTAFYCRQIRLKLTEKCNQIIDMVIDKHQANFNITSVTLELTSYTSSSALVISWILYSFKALKELKIIVPLQRRIEDEMLLIGEISEYLSNVNPLDVSLRSLEVKFLSPIVGVAFLYIIKGIIELSYTTLERLCIDGATLQVKAKQYQHQVSRTCLLQIQGLLDGLDGSTIIKDFSVRNLSLIFNDEDFDILFTWRNLRHLNITGVQGHLPSEASHKFLERYPLLRTLTLNKSFTTPSILHFPHKILEYLDLTDCTSCLITQSQLSKILNGKMKGFILKGVLSEDIPEQELQRLSVRYNLSGLRKPTESERLRGQAAQSSSVGKSQGQSSKQQGRHVKSDDTSKDISIDEEQEVNISINNPTSQSQKIKQTNEGDDERFQEDQYVQSLKDTPQFDEKWEEFILKNGPIKSLAGTVVKNANPICSSFQQKQRSNYTFKNKSSNKNENTSCKYSEAIQSNQKPNSESDSDSSIEINYDEKNQGENSKYEISMQDKADVFLTRSQNQKIKCKRIVDDPRLASSSGINLGSIVVLNSRQIVRTTGDED
ncbi:hypothetical protein FGO68_gene13116 [Halteria grandinella]|uniref:Uncharacterized protein n=1 Tax=Halteria grandinella TaxID=5974 RepID=A0A8J8P2D4_HALGN|nr:hypothetical protein FGO68_gene13116 [Halteria grandinella]